MVNKDLNELIDSCTDIDTLEEIKTVRNETVRIRVRAITELERMITLLRQNIKEDLETYDRALGRILHLKGSEYDD